MMKLFVAVLTVLAVPYVGRFELRSAAGQTLPPPQPQQPVFTSRVDLIALDVTVVDKDGKPITGLKAGDFAVKINGKTGSVKQLDYETFGSAPGSEVAVASREVSNQTAAAVQASRGGRVIVLLIDDLSARPTQGKFLVFAAERILKTLDMGDLVGLTTTSGLGPAVSPTRDRSVVLATLKSKAVMGRNENVTAPFVVTVDEALAFDRGFDSETMRWVIRRECSMVDLGPGCADLVVAAARRLARDTIHRAAMQLQAYASIITALKPAPAPRIVIALSTGVAPGADGDYLQLEPVSRAAAEAGVQFYALTEVADLTDASEVAAAANLPGMPPQYDRPFARKRENDFLTSGVQVVANAAGGEAFRVVGQADRFFKRIIAETSGIYRLGVEAPLPANTARLLDVKVSVNRPGVTVRANHHALVPSAKAEALTPEKLDEALRTRIASGGVAFGVPIALATSLRRDPAKDAELQLGVNVQIPGGVPAPLVAMYSLVNSAGQVVKAGKQTIQTAAGEDYQIAFPVGTAPGAYRLRFAAADAVGNIGSVEYAVNAKLAHVGTFSVSDLVTSWEDAAGRRRFLALETLPSNAAAVGSFIELYPDTRASPASATVRFALLRAGETKPMREEDATVSSTPGGLTASVEIPVQQLEPGSYTLRATISEGGVVTGAVTTSFRKSG
jgi:VWFA-related protein